MRWHGGRRSTNIEDRRGMRVGRPLAMGGGLITLVAVLLTVLFGGNPEDVLVQAPSGPEGNGFAAAPDEEQLGEFVSVVLADTEDTWPRVLECSGADYELPRLVLFTDAVESACGVQASAVGPFYCPLDEKLYLDLAFFRDLEQLGGPGDFAQAYVVAHEVGHHVQNELGISERTHAARQRMSQEDSNALSVRVELQADCFAGVWAHHAARRDLLEPGDLEEGLAAAAAIGDDRLQHRSQGQVVPESFTHGSSRQRVAWFRRGFESGTVGACDTFRAM